MKKIPKQEYTAEFKEQAVKHAQAVGIVVAAKELGLVEQTLRNWVKASAAGKLTAAGAKPVPSRCQAGDAKTDGTVQAARVERAAEDACRHLKKSEAYFAKDAL